MRVLSRVALVVVVLAGLSSSPLLADHSLSECELTLVNTSPAASAFGLSPHGVFRSGTQVYALRGQTVTTYTATDVGDLQVAREDFIGTMGARDVNAGVTFSNGYLFVSGEAGLEIFDVRNTRAGGTAPLFVSRSRGMHYSRLAVSGNILAALNPINEMQCVPMGSLACFNTIDLYDVSNLNNPVRVGTIASGNFLYYGFNDIAFNQGFLYATGENGTFGFNVNNPGLPLAVGSTTTLGKFLVTNGTNLLGVGNDGQIDLFLIGLSGVMTRFAIYTLPYETFDRANPIAFHRQGWIDEQNGRLITMINEIDRQTLTPARTIAFDVFDLTAPLWQGQYERGNESISYVIPDEVKHNPVAVGPYIYVIGEMSGLETYGACGQVTGEIDWDGTAALSCGGAELRGWVTGSQKVANVELFLDNASLGPATLTQRPRPDVSAKTPVQAWRVTVNLDQTTRGEHTLRAVGTDVLGNRRQFASQRVFFNGPGKNCSTRFRAVR